MTLTNPDFIAIDTETGGVRPGRHALLSIAAVPSWDRGRGFSVFTEPFEGSIVEPEAAKKNGYNASLWTQRGAVPLELGMLRLTDWLRECFKQKPGALMLAHNAGFDRMFLDEASHITGLQLPIRHAWRCSMDKLGTLMDRGIIPAGRANLDRLGELAGLWPVGARPAVHEAAGDAMACLLGYEWLLEKEKGGPGLEVIQWETDTHPDDDTSVIVETESGCDTGFLDAGNWVWSNGRLITEKVIAWAHLPIGTQKGRAAL